MRKVVTGNPQQKGFVGRTLALKMGAPTYGLRWISLLRSPHLKCFAKRRDRPLADGRVPCLLTNPKHGTYPFANELLPKRRGGSRCSATAPWYSQRHRNGG